jgi:bifunctional oligoribonuclease and PAP phosphatase NrnA
MRPIAEVYSLLETKRKIIITMHQKPDGDAMGAGLGLYHFFVSLGHDVDIISPTNWAKFLNWMPGCDKVVDFEVNIENHSSMVQNAGLVFCLDYNALYRTKKMETALEQTTGIRILIDHHQQPEEEKFAFGASNVAKSSTCEMVYDFIMQSPWGEKMNLDIATCLYTGIMTDTGSFRFAITSAQVHRIIAHFKDMGLQHSVIHDNIYDDFSEQRLRFIGNALLNRLEVLYEYNTAMMAISKRDITQFDIQTGDTEGLVNYLLTIEGMQLGALLIDRVEERKWSFRSKGNFDVNEFARKHFEGGGHKNAAGGRSSEGLEQNIKKFKEVLKQYENQLN